MAILYGISNCDNVKKAMVWLKENKVPFAFHDYKKEGIGKKKLEQWLLSQPLDVILNKRSTAWKELNADQRACADTQAGAVKLMQEFPNLVKRPVLEIPGTILVGFNEADYKKIPGN